MAKFLCFINLAEFPAGVATQPLLIYLSISRVIKLQSKQGQTRWKANISSYNFYEKPSLNFIIFRPKFSWESRRRIYPFFHQQIKYISNLPKYDLPRPFTLIFALLPLFCFIRWSSTTLRNRHIVFCIYNFLHFATIPKTRHKPYMQPINSFPPFMTYKTDLRNSHIIKLSCFLCQLSFCYT